MELKRILHVEDNEDMREIAKIALEVVGGFELKQFSDGISAINAVKTFKPDVLLFDVMMPTLSGPETYAKIKAIPGYENTPAIFLTVKAQARYAAEFKAQGAIGVISKPFDPMYLAAEIESLWQTSRIAA